MVQIIKGKLFDIILQEYCESYKRDIILDKLYFYIWIYIHIYVCILAYSVSLINLVLYMWGEQSIVFVYKFIVSMYNQLNPSIKDLFRLLTNYFLLFSGDLAVLIILEALLVDFQRPNCQSAQLFNPFAYFVLL